jgi:ABC-2 type transport system permease protein
MLAERLPVLAAVLRERRRSLVGWAVALAAVCGIYVSFWPAMGEGAEMQALIDSMPEGLVTAMGYDGIGTPAGYLESTVFALLGPALLLVFAIGTGARLFAGEEEDGTLELELTHPVGRSRVLGERLLALALSVVGLTLVAFATTLGLVTALDMDVASEGIAAASVGMGLLVLTFGVLTLGVGAATGRRAAALSVGAGLAVLTYVADAVAPMVEWGGWLEAISPFSWYLGPEPLVAGFAPEVLGGMAGLAAVMLVAFLVGVTGLGRRDLLT